MNRSLAIAWSVLDRVPHARGDEPSLQRIHLGQHPSQDAAVMGELMAMYKAFPYALRELYESIDVNDVQIVA